MTTIKFYTMSGCGYCTKAHDLLKNEINRGEVEVLSSHKAPSSVSGFPYFEYKNKTHTGYPQTVNALHKALEYNKENYHGDVVGMSKTGLMTNQSQWPNCNKFSGYLGGVYKQSDLDMLNAGSYENYKGVFNIPREWEGVL
jgi:glutaredoxin